MVSLNKRMQQGSPSVSKLFDRASSARTVTSGPSMMRVLGMQHRSGSMLNGFAGGFGGLGELPSLTPTGGGAATLKQLLDPIQGSIAAVRNVRASIEPLLQEQSTSGRIFAATVKGAEDELNTLWTDLVASASRVASAETAAPEFDPAKPDISKYQYSGGGAWYQAALKEWRAGSGANIKPDINDYYYEGGNGWYQSDLQAWKDRIRSALVTKLNALQTKLDAYVQTVPAAAGAVQKVIAAQTEATVAQATLESARAKGATLEAMKPLVVAAKAAEEEVAKRNAAAAAAAAAVKKGKTTTIGLLLGGALVIGVGVYLLKRKK